MIEFKNVNKSYTQNKTTFHALHDINICIEDGAIVGILGQSGAGKSTLLRMINGLSTPSSGQIIIDGRQTQQLSSHNLRSLRHCMGMIFQNFNLLASKTIYQNIAVALHAIGLAKSLHHNRIMGVLAEVGLSHKVDNYPSQLSGGEKQRVGIARALVTKPKYLLCDEITSALDPKTAKEILQLLDRIHRQRKLTIIFITHQIEAVMHLCQDIILMNQGKVVHQSSTLDFFLHLNNPNTIDYLKNILYDVPIEHDEVYQLIYIGELLQEQSMLSHMIRTFNVDVNIIHAKILLIRHQRLGYLYLQILGPKANLALEYLRAHGIIVHAIENQLLKEASHAIE